MPGKNNLACYMTVLQDKHGLNTKHGTQTNNFSFGNNNTEQSTRVARVLVDIGGDKSRNVVAGISGEAPLLLSKLCLQSLGGIIECEKETNLVDKAAAYRGFSRGRIWTFLGEPHGLCLPVARRRPGDHQ